VGGLLREYHVPPVFAGRIERSSGTTLADRTPAKLQCFTRDDAIATWPSILGHVMISPRPRLGSARAEQKLIELALLDRSDREAASELRFSAEAIKKRRSRFMRRFRESTPPF